MSSRKFGVDISNFDGDVSIDKLKRAGVEFVIARVGGADDEEVGKYSDSKWAQNYANCKKAGMPVGAYYLLGGTTEAEARDEARHCKQLLGSAQLEYPVYLDMEGKTHKSMGEGARRKVVQAWVDEMGGGWLCGCYTWSWLMPSGVKNCELWTCDWGVVRPSNDCGMWQFGGETNELRSTRVAGYGPIDQDYCYVDYPSLVKQRGLNGFKASGKEESVATLRDKVVERARSQIGVRYYSMHTGPRGSAVEGWGCAMFYAWCLNQTLGTGYYGSCWNFAGDALGQGTNQGGGEFEFISASEAQPGDAVLYAQAGHDGKDYDDYGHIALYVGGGRVIGAMGSGTPGSAGYLNIGIKETDVGRQSLGGPIRYVRCKRLKGNAATPATGNNSSYADTGEMVWVNQKVTVRSSSLNVRDKPSTKTGAIKAEYRKGDTIILDGLVLGDGYVWGSYVGATSGKRRYVALGDLELAR